MADDGQMRALTTLAVLPLALAGCGGDDGACADFAACGGAVTGAWEIRSTCLTGSPDLGFSEQCRGATVDISGMQVRGSINLNADMSYVRTTMLGGSMSATLPASCLTVEGIALTCAQLQMALSRNIAEDPDDSPFSSATCGAAGGGGCTCTLAYKPITESDMGSYTVTGNVLSLRERGADDSETFEYCASGNNLKLKSSSMSGMMGSMGSMPDEDIGGVISLEKK
jgi:hypothetical protein